MRTTSAINRFMGIIIFSLFRYQAEANIRAAAARVHAAEGPDIIPFSINAQSNLTSFSAAQELFL